MTGEINGIGKKRKHLIQNAILFMEEQLNLSDIVIDVEVSNLFRNENAFGFCLSYTPTEFLIELDRTLDSYDLIETICHEMIHVKQYATGELKEDGVSVVYKNCSYVLNNDDSFPWEQEAYNNEKYYAELFLEYWNNGLK